MFFPRRPLNDNLVNKVGPARYGNTLESTGARRPILDGGGYDYPGTPYWSPMRLPSRVSLYAPFLLASRASRSV